MSSRPQGGSCFSLRIFFFVSRHLPPCPIFLVEPILQVLPLDMRGMGGVHPLRSRKSGGLFSLLPYFLTSSFSMIVRHACHVVGHFRIPPQRRHPCFIAGGKVADCNSHRAVAQQLAG